VLHVDHLVRAVSDLDVSARTFAGQHGLASVPGGRHPSWGTGNRIVPLGDAYIELLAVVEPNVARTTVLGTAIAETAAAGDGWFAMCLADDRIDETAARLELDVRDGRRSLPDGRVVRWRSAGLDDPRRTPDLPFFIEWAGSPDGHPGRVDVEHPAGAVRLAEVEVASTPERFAAWTDSQPLPVRIVEGKRGVRAVTLDAHGRRLVLR
jgi:hypothetical protein